MKQLILAIWVVGVFAIGVNAMTIETDAEKEVADVERAFAQSMADRDFEAFKSFLDPDAIFQGPGKHLRGAEAVAAVWGNYFKGEQAPFSWKPESVMVLPEGNLALSTGPVSTPDGRITAYYTSTWRKGADGQWRIIFDKGQRYCPPEHQN